MQIDRKPGSLHSGYQLGERRLRAQADIPAPNDKWRDLGRKQPVQGSARESLLSRNRCSKPARPQVFPFSPYFAGVQVGWFGAGNRQATVSYSSFLIYQQRTLASLNSQMCYSRLMHLTSTQGPTNLVRADQRFPESRRLVATPDEQAAKFVARRFCAISAPASQHIHTARLARRTGPP